MLNFASHHKLYNTENRKTSKVVYSLCVTKQLLQDILQLHWFCTAQSRLITSYGYESVVFFQKITK